MCISILFMIEYGVRVCKEDTIYTSFCLLLLTWNFFLLNILKIFFYEKRQKVLKINHFMLNQTVLHTYNSILSINRNFMLNQMVLHTYVHITMIKVLTILIYRSRSWSADHFLIWSLIIFYHFSRSRSWSDFRSLFNWSWSDFKITFSDHFFQKTRIF